MSLPHILLGILRQPASGYDLKARFQRDIRLFWSAELSQIYPTLKRMEKKGWLTSVVEPSDRGPDRRVYRTTPRGRTELRRWLASGPQVGSERFEYLAQLFFMDEIDDPVAARAFMVALRAHLAAWRAELAVIETHLEHAAGFPDGLESRHFYPHIGLRMGLHTLAAKVAWCDETIARLDRRVARAGAARAAKEA